ncbi:MAG: hypothetical protein NC917_05055, partial [Candidatus Omnitrophica bacterium]|nr:hypothetical protein [Candidatus Omnitrophota bacterium]
IAFRGELLLIGYQVYKKGWFWNYPDKLISKLELIKRKIFEVLTNPIVKNELIFYFESFLQLTIFPDKK